MDAEFCQNNVAAFIIWEVEGLTPLVVGVVSLEI